MAFVCRPTLSTSTKKIVKRIMKNDIASIQNMFDDISTEKRKAIVSEKYNGKTPLIHACEHNATTVAEYLITVCGADLQEVIEEDQKLLTPLFIAVKHSSNNMVKLLVDLGANVKWTDPEGRNVLVFACELANTQAASILERHVNINCYKNYCLCLENPLYLERALKYGTSPVCTDTFGNTLFMKAIITNNYEAMRLLRTKPVSTKLRNSIGANALDLATMKCDQRVFDFVKDLYTVYDQVLSFEYCGARNILCDRIEVGLSFWKESIEMRRVSIEIMHSKESFFCEKLEEFNLFEFDDENDLLRCNIADYYLQSLLVFLRIFPSNWSVVADAFTTVAMSDEFEGRIDLRFALIRQLLSFSKPGDDPSKAMTGAVSLSEKLFKAIYTNTTAENMTVFNMLSNFITSDVGPFLTEQPFCKEYFFGYIDLLNILLKFVQVFVSEKRYTNHPQFRSNIKDAARQYISTFPTSLLHVAISRQFSFDTVVLLAESKADVDAVDFHGNTPFHLVLERPDSDPFKCSLCMLLIKAGCNMDATNKSGVVLREHFKRPLENAVSTNNTTHTPPHTTTHTPPHTTTHTTTHTPPHTPPHTTTHTPPHTTTHTTTHTPPHTTTHTHTPPHTTTHTHTPPHTTTHTHTPPHITTHTPTPPPTTTVVEDNGMDIAASDNQTLPNII